MLAFQVAVRRKLLVENNLGDAGAVAKIEEDEVAVIAAPVDPAHQDYGLPNVGEARRSPQ